MEASEEVKHGCYFRDNIRRADYVIVVKKASRLLINYVISLEKIGLQFELNKKPELQEVFLSIHIPQEQLETYSKIYDIGIDVPMTILTKEKPKCCKWWQLDLEVPDKKKGEFTSMERIMIIQKILERAKFDIGEEDAGLSKLLKQHKIIDAYPLHDGPATISTPSLSRNDRQLLHLHWASFSCWYKEIPLDLIQKYFGCEIAFYFAWVEYFNFMLLPAAIVGLSVFIANLILVNTVKINTIRETCNAHGMLVCPVCSYQKYCVYKKVSKFCFAAKGTYVFDNFLTVAFAVFMSFWATVFLNLWQRKQSELKMKWNVQYVEDEESHVRHEYQDELKKRKIKRTPGGLEPFLPKHVTIIRIVITVSICLFMILLVLVAVFGVIVFKIIVTAEASIGNSPFFKSNAKHVAMITGSILQVIFINIFGKIYGKLSIWLTNFENPRTLQDFDKSVLYKRYFLSFVNNYAALFYLAFVKSRLYHLPPRAHNFVLNILEADTCHPTNCIFPLTIQLSFLMLFKKLAGNIYTLIVLNCQTMRKRKKLERAAHITTDVPQYEADYLLLPTNRYLLTSEFCQMIIEFGFVTFFVAAFPLAPLCAFLNNILEQRLDAMKLVVNYRRPLPRKTSGIGAWDGILLGVTYLSIATNALVIGFTSDFVIRSRYRWTIEIDLSGFVNSTLSVFSTEDYHLFKNLPPKPDVCYYGGKRYPPDDREKYQFTTDYWADTAYRLICIFIFEHLMFLSNGILSYAIPDLPKSVKEQMNVDRQLIKEAKLRNVSSKIDSAITKSSHDNQWLIP